MGVVLVVSGCGQQKFSPLSRALEKNPPFRTPGSAPVVSRVDAAAEDDTLKTTCNIDTGTDERLQKWTRYLVLLQHVEFTLGIACP